MGCCFSKKDENGGSPVVLPTKSSHTQKLQIEIPVQKQKIVMVVAEQQQQVEEIVKKKKSIEEESSSIVKKEVFIIKHRKSHDKEKHKLIGEDKEEEKTDVCEKIGKVRTSSCSKEELDAILIQCGRLSRSNSNSSGKPNSSATKKYSGSKRSFDFDAEEVKGNDDADEELDRSRSKNKPSSSSPSRRRRTPSRERDQNLQKQRSGSRERSSGNGGSSSRRLSRSPAKRSENNISNGNQIGGRPGKMVSVPATVSSASSLDKSNNGVVKRISVKRNLGAVSPRNQSPARGNGKENQQQPPLIRTPSRKAENSPYRRNPLSEIDHNSLSYPQSTTNNKGLSNNNIRCKDIEPGSALNQKQNMEMMNMNTQYVKDVSAITTTIVQAEPESLKPHSITRTRSSRRSSRDLDINLPETESESSYTRLLLEDIQNFHQKSTSGINPSSFSLPCLTKACSILEAVADLNSTTRSNISFDERKNSVVESEVVVKNDLMDPSFEKYVTVSRGGGKLEDEVVDVDENESSGSNSFMGTGSQLNWGLSSSWEPSSADSTGCWNSRNIVKEEDHGSALPVRQTLTESGHDIDEARKGVSGKRRGIGRNVMVSGKTPPVLVAATASR